MSGRQLIRTDPRTVRAILDDAERTSVAAAARAHGVDHKTVYRWRGFRTADPAWPSDEYIDAWVTADREHAARRARDRAWGRRYRVDTILGRPARTVDATGTMRRLQALYALGWTSRQIGPRLGVTAALVGHLVNGKYPVLHRTTAAAVTRVYDELSMTVPQDDDATRNARAGRIHERQRRLAAKRGWVPPLAWDDETLDDPTATPTTGRRVRALRTRHDEAIVDRLLAGEWHLPSSRPERTEVVDRWVASGRPVNELARLTGWKVERYYDTESEVA